MIRRRIPAFLSEQHVGLEAIHRLPGVPGRASSDEEVVGHESHVRRLTSIPPIARSANVVLISQRVRRDARPGRATPPRPPPSTTPARRGPRRDRVCALPRRPAAAPPPPRDPPPRRARGGGASTRR